MEHKFAQDAMLSFQMNLMRLAGACQPVAEREEVRREQTRLVEYVTAVHAA